MGPQSFYPDISLRIEKGRSIKLITVEKLLKVFYLLYLFVWASDDQIQKEIQNVLLMFSIFVQIFLFKTLNLVDIAELLVMDEFLIKFPFLKLRGN